MTKIKLFAGALVALPLALIAGQASAQSINYSALQDVFGEPVTTSATGSPQRASEAPVAMDIITAEDIKHSGATDIPTILSRVAGIDVDTWSANGVADVAVRGYSSPYSPRLLVLINGRQVYLDDYGYVAWTTIPVELSEIKQIEVIKGPNAALFGFNAVGGVVNIITDNPRYDNTNSGTVSAGANGFSSGSLVSTFHLGDRVQVRLSGGAQAENQWKNDGAIPVGDLGVSHPSKVEGNIDVVTELTQHTELRVEGSWSHAIENDAVPDGAYDNTNYLTNSAKVTLNSETQFGLVTVDVYHNNLNVLNQSATIAPAYIKDAVTVAQVEDLFKIGANHTFRVALEYRHNTENVVNASGFLHDNIYAASGMWNWAVNSKLAVTAAVRYDSMVLSREGGFQAGLPLNNNALYNRTVNEPSANVGVTYKATDNDSFRASFGRGVEVPSLIELGGLNIAIPVGGGHFFGIVSSPNTEPTTVTNYDLGYDRDLPKLGAKATLDLYLEETDHLLGLDNPSSLAFLPTATTYPSILFYNDAASSQAAGVELTVKGKIKGGYRWGVDYSYEDITEKAYPGQNLNVEHANFRKTTPTDLVNLNLGWSNDKWSADVFGRYVSSYQSTFNTTSSGDYWTLAAHGAYAITPKISLGVTVENALEQRQVQSSALEATRRVFATLSTTW